MESPGIILAFFALSGVTVASALLVFVARNLLHALAFLVISFLGMAGLFLTLSADFIAVAQVLIWITNCRRSAPVDNVTIRLSENEVSTASTWL